MKELNKGTKKLIKILERESLRLEKEIEKIVKCAKQKALLFRTDLNERTNFDNQSDFLNYITEKTVSLYSDEQLLVYNKYRLVNITLESILEENTFNDFELLQVYFENYNFTKEYQIEVLGHILRTNINNFAIAEEKLKNNKNADGTFNEEFKIAFDEFLKTKNIKLSNRPDDEAFAHMDTTIFEDETVEIFSNYKNLSKYIDNRGIFLPSNELEALFEILINTRLSFTKEQMILIIEVVSNKYITKFLDEEKKKISVAIPNAEKPEINLVNKEEVWTAKQIVKKYLNNDQLSYMSDIDIVSLTAALITLDYSDAEIAKIQTSIIRNNENIEKEQEDISFGEAKAKYLSEAEINILNSVEALINSEDPIINPTFNIIKNDYEFVKNELTRLYKLNDDNNVDLNDNAELVIDAIEEISEKIPEYLYSDYRFSRTLVTEE